MKYNNTHYFNKHKIVKEYYFKIDKYKFLTKILLYNLIYIHLTFGVVFCGHTTPSPTGLPEFPKIGKGHKVGFLPNTCTQL
jgi:hypothetical protein